MEKLPKLTVLADTREQPTAAFQRRMAAMGLPWRRQKLDFGDYSCEVTPPGGGKPYNLSRLFAIERKMHLDELCACFTGGRERFTREFERAKAAGARVYLLVENATLQLAIEGKYHSRMNPKALVASLFAFTARYGCIPVFVSAKNAASVMREIIRFEAGEKWKDVCDLLQDRNNGSSGNRKLLDSLPGV